MAGRAGFLHTENRATWYFLGRHDMTRPAEQFISFR